MNENDMSPEFAWPLQSLKTGTTVTTSKKLQLG